MKLNIALVIFALFAHSECNNSEYFSMNLSPASQSSIRSILENHSGITEPEAFIANINELGRTFSHVDELGSVQLAEAFVRAYNAKEICEKEIQNLMKEAVCVGNVNAYVYFSQIIPYSNIDVLEIAAANGQLDIIKREYAIIGFRYNYYTKFISAAIRAGHLHVFRWFAEKGLLFNFDGIKLILEAIETRCQEIIDYMLQAQIYADYNNPNNRSKYKTFLKNEYHRDYTSVFIKAAEFGNMGVVRYYFDGKWKFCRTYLERAQIAAYKKGHSEIAALIGQRVFEYLQGKVKHRLLSYCDVEQGLIAAFEVNHQKVIDYLLHEQIYPHPSNMETLLTYEDRMRIGEFIEIEDVFVKAAEFGNIGFVRYYLDKNFSIHQSDLELSQKVAYKKGHSEIAALIGQRVFENLHSKGEHGLLSLADVKEALIAALEVNHQKVIDYLLYEQIHPHPFNMETRLTYEDRLRIGDYFGHEKIFKKAAEFGNVEVFGFYMGRQFFTTENNLREAQQVALKNGHNDIADSICTFFMI